MKIEINDENKARFFAVYWGQKVMKTDMSALILADPIAVRSSSEFYLNLKPLSSISDEDANTFFELNGGNPYCTEEFKIACGKKDVSKPELLNGIVYDFLRSKSYALPWMGLSVDEMLEAGWIKLTES